MVSDSPSLVSASCSFRAGFPRRAPVLANFRRKGGTSVGWHVDCRASGGARTMTDKPKPSELALRDALGTID